jgi:ubiquinone/menaquinone biosynthesis C-methylase UbiE
MQFKNKAVGFDGPTQAPRDGGQRRKWQDANRSWWEAAPMRYDWREAIAPDPGSEAYFKEIDRRFFTAARSFLPWRRMPFDTVIPFDQLASRDVLEIGVGHGSHAQLLAPHCKSFAGIDLTASAVNTTYARLRLFRLPGNVLQMDAEQMAFVDSVFDYAWSWGVIHHSADTKRVLAEIHRVLRPRGRCTVMVYYRSWWSHYVCGFLRGLLQGGWQRGLALHHISQSATDGAIARYYKPAEWRRATENLFATTSLHICGLKTDILPLPHGRLKNLLLAVLPHSLARFLTSHVRMGSLLIAQMHSRKEVNSSI